MNNMNLGDIFRGFFGYPPRRGHTLIDHADWPPESGHDRSCPDCRVDCENDNSKEDFPHAEKFGFFEFFPNRPRSHYSDDACEEDHNYQDHGGDNHTFQFHFSEADDMMKHFDNMFRSFEDVFRSMGIADFNPSHGFPSIEGAPVHPREDEGKPGNLRDRMLKEPDSNQSDPEQKQTPPPSSSRPEDFSPAHPFRGRLWAPFNWGTQKPTTEDKVDRDLDGELKPGDLGRLFPPQEDTKDKGMEVHSQQPYRAYSPGGTVYRGVSVHTYRSADGKEEERRTLRDGEGNEETTVTRALGDQVHTVITHSDGYSGKKNKVENYTNMDERDRTDFDRKWNTPSRGPGPDIFNDDALDDKSPLRNLFGFGFPGFGKKQS